MIADIDDPSHIHHGAPGEPLFCTETVEVFPNTRLWSIFDQRNLHVWTAHHQAVDRLGEGLVISASASDNSIEAIEDPTRWFLGVQWHPERAAASADDRRKPFGALVSACR